MEAENGFNMGRSAEITRDEVKFQKFIDKIRMRFCSMFLQLLRTQVLLKGIMSEDDWKMIEIDINFDYNRDSYFSELKESEIMRDRLELLSQADEYIGKYYSVDWVRRNILQQTEEEIASMDIQMQKELESQPQEEEEGYENEQY